MNRVKSTQEIGRVTEEAFRQTAKLPFVVVLDNVRSQHNVGAVLRTADAFALDAVYLCGICPPADSVEVHKTALGAEQTVHSEQFAHTTDAIRQLKQNGYKVYAVELTTNSITPDQVPVAPGEKIAIVLGHEVFGVQQEVVDLCDGAIEIEQYGTKHSLNVSVAAGVVMYQIMKQLRRA